MTVVSGTPNYLTQPAEQIWFGRKNRTECHASGPVLNRVFVARHAWMRLDECGVFMCNKLSTCKAGLDFPIESAVIKQTRLISRAARTARFV